MQLHLDQTVKNQRGHALLLIVLFKQDLHHGVSAKKEKFSCVTTKFLNTGTFVTKRNVTSNLF